MTANLAYHKRVSAPFKHWQLDSWWYPIGDGIYDRHNHLIVHVLEPLDEDVEIV